MGFLHSETNRSFWNGKGFRPETSTQIWSSTQGFEFQLPIVICTIFCLILEYKSWFEQPEKNLLFHIKWKRFKKIAWIWSHHLQWKFKLLAEKFTWGNEAKHCWVMSTTFLFSRACWQCPAMFCFTPQGNSPAHNLDFHWSWRWWDQIQTTF